MSIAITEDHTALADTAADFLASRGSLAAARALLEAPDEPMPALWDDLASLGWLGLHIPEANGGSGYGIAELVVVVEAMGRALTPGPFVPTVIASATLVAAGDADVASRYLPGLADGSVVGAVGLGGTVVVTDGVASGSAGTVLGGGLASVMLVAVGDDVAVVDLGGPGVTLTTPSSLDPTRRSARVTLDGAPVTVRCRVPRWRCETCHGWFCRLRPWASPVSAPIRPPPTPRCVSSSAGPSPCSRP